MRGFEDEFFADPDHGAYRAKEQAVLDAARAYESAFNERNMEKCIHAMKAVRKAVRALDGE